MLEPGPVCDGQVQKGSRNRSNGNFSVLFKLLRRDVLLTSFPEVGRSQPSRTFSSQRALVPAAYPSVYCSGRWLGHKKCVQLACLCPLLLGLG